MRLSGYGAGTKIKGGFFGGTKASKDPVFNFLCTIKYDINFYFKLIGFKPTWQQQELVDAFVAGHPNISVRSGKGPGKTAATAALIPWWSLTNFMSQAVVTAPTEAQCKNVWLSQAQKWIMDGDPRIKYFFSFTGKGYGIRHHKNELWGCYIRTATRPENFQGIHNERLLIYCEEASGVARPIMQAIQDTLTGSKSAWGPEKLQQWVNDREDRALSDVQKIQQAKLDRKNAALNRWLCVGNPNTRTCRFFDFFNSLAGAPWLPLHWNAEETPITPWFSGERNIEIEEEFGKDSDVYRVAVLGEFPSLDPDSILSDAEVNACFGLKAYEKAFNHPDNKKQIGIDLARMGGDECASVYRSGRLALKMEFKSHTDPSDWIDRACAEQDTLKWNTKECVYVVDTSGMGEGAVGRLGSKRRIGKRVHEFYSQNRAHESKKYVDKITEAWFGFRRMVRSGEIYLGEKPDRRLVMQLTNRKYKIDEKTGRLKVESKEDYKKRMADIDTGGELGKSPDRADAVVMAFYEHASDSQRVAV
jgi:hypothetical protein